ncbi:DUF4143 domain-containing protein [Corynebacterium hindlerae]|uniref:DUF4143 domain-containing protein n=1 Tax=Corynebacterium hindlerae TaxID=699041 RepID=UPI0031B72C5A
MSTLSGGQRNRVSLRAPLAGIVGGSFGLLASAFAENEFQAVQFMPVFFGPQFFLGGVLVPRSDMNSVLQVVSNFLPLSYVIDVLRKLLVSTEIYGEFWRDMSIVATFAVGALILAAVSMPRATNTYRFDRENERALIEASMDELLTSEGSVCLDEWQHVPQVWDAVRRLVDDGNSTRFFLNGSATPRTGIDIHSGAGRILSLRMRPLSVAERVGTTPTVYIADLFEGTAEVRGETDWTLQRYADAVCSTGLPGIYQMSGRMRRQAIDSYIGRVIDRDIADQGLMVRKPESMRAWWAAYAASSSTTTAYNKILDAATPGDARKVSKDAALAYRDALTALWLLDPVPAWFPNRSPFKKLTTGPKHQVFDPGIAAALIGVTPEMLVSQDPGSWELFGQLFESLATLTVRAAGQAAEAHTSHLRTQGKSCHHDGHACLSTPRWCHRCPTGIAWVGNHWI